MAWKIVIAESAIEDFRWFGRKEGRLLLETAFERLLNDPLAENRNLNT